MSRNKNFLLGVLVALLFMLVFPGTSLAFKTGAPSSKDGDPPYGLNVQGNAAGDKLNGVIQISFFNLDCYPGLGACGLNGDKPNGAYARVTLRLSRTNTNSDDDTKAFYAELPYPVSVINGAAVQGSVLEYFKPLILDAFFNGNDLGICTKEFSLYSEEPLAGWVSPIPNEDCLDPNDPGEPGYLGVDFTAIASIVLAVKEGNCPPE